MPSFRQTPVHNELRHVATQLLKAGADRIHYFHAGPAVALVGAEFANGACVLFYSDGSRSLTPEPRHRRPI